MSNYDDFVELINKLIKDDTQLFDRVLKELSQKDKLIAELKSKIYNLNSALENQENQICDYQIEQLKFTQNKLAIEELEYIYTYPFNLYSDGPEWLISRKDLEIKIKELIRRLERK